MKAKRIIIGGLTGGFIVTLIAALVTIFPDMQANGGMQQWFRYRSQIAGFADVVATIIGSLVVGFIVGALGTAGASSNIQQSPGNVGKTIEDSNSNALIDLETKNGIKSGALSILKILVAIILFLVLCSVLAILTDYH